MLQKYAVRCGGAHNHIFNLSNCVLVKDNHIKIAGGIRNAVEILRSHAQHTFKFEVECETLEMVQEALDCEVEVIMFDNMDLDEIKAGLKLVNGRAITEASGGINERTIVPIAETGVDVISVGDLTHSVTSVDISLDVQDIKPSAIRTIERLRAATGCMVFRQAHTRSRRAGATARLRPSGSHRHRGDLHSRAGIELPDLGTGRFQDFRARLHALPRFRQGDRTWGTRGGFAPVWCGER